MGVVKPASDMQDSGYWSSLLLARSTDNTAQTMSYKKQSEK